MADPAHGLREGDTIEVYYESVQGTGGMAWNATVTDADVEDDRTLVVERSDESGCDGKLYQLDLHDDAVITHLIPKRVIGRDLSVERRSRVS